MSGVAFGWTPVPLDIVAHRWARFHTTIDVRYVNLLGATFALQVRPYGDAPGTALLSLGNADAPVQGVSVAYATIGDVATSNIDIRINETTLEALPFPTPRGGDLRLRWDLLIDTPALGKLRWFEGEFIVKAGATHG